MTSPRPATSSNPPSSRLEELLSDATRFEELSDDDTMDEIDEPLQEVHLKTTPALFTCLPPIQDELRTPTSDLQEKTIQEVLPFHIENLYGCELNSYDVMKLLRSKHIAFLTSSLGEYPSSHAVMDASRPWLIYWALTGLSLLGGSVSQYRERAIYTFSACQNPTGGFGGGHGQMAHLAPTYAAILCLITVGGEEAFEAIDRKAMWHYLGRMKQKDGGFTMADGGEEDVRGAYCAMTVISLLNLPLELPPDSPARVNGDETFLTGLGEWISRCQTYEGGIGAAPGNEAHGAYTFCALACLCIMGKPYETIPKYLNLSMLLSWLSARQYAPEGGMGGRTNKLVDGCYSHWAGSCWPLVEAAVNGPEHVLKGRHLWSREGLTRYILSCCQERRGGLRDKPSKPPDAYHSCYNLCGLSAAQHTYDYSDRAGSAFKDSPLDAAFRWSVTEELTDAERVWDEDDEVALLHPVYSVPWGVAEEAKRYFEAKVGF